MVLASPSMTTPTLHQATTDGAIVSTFELIQRHPNQDSATTMATTINQPTGTTA